ncbi:MFS transporter [Sphingomonas jatrophae]|uniref:Nitrate/nitrite transporter NarK n=1 Tax=Sphingomonas jatrophae TaxID=1166337 RepID=A0A1I6KCQ7_9SPHN|nr:MFS transporter [Sphingomonas jatrophae]SFR89001.1 Nitrate/nitrite transporter NarK [Sphingomonas jatrophae]
MSVQDPAAGRYPRPALAWLSVAILFILYIRSLADRYLIALVVDPIKQDVGITDFQISLLQGPAFAVLYCLFAIPVGLALDRYNRRWVLFLSVLVWSVGAAACGMASTFAALAVARALVGGGESGFSTGAYSIIGDSFPPSRLSLAMSVFVMGGIMGAGIVFLLGGPFVQFVLSGGASHWPLMASFAPWQQAFILTGVPGIAMAFLVLLVTEPVRQARATPAGGAGYGEAIRFLGRHKRLFWGIFLGFGMAYTSTISLQLWLPAYFARVHGWPTSQIGVVLGVAQMLAALSLPLHGAIVNRFYKAGRRDAPLFWCIIAIAIAAPCALIALTASNPWVTVVMFGCYMTFILATASMGPAATQVVTPQALRGRVSAIYVLTTGLIGMSVGPALVGYLTDHVFGSPQAVGTSLVVIVLGMLIPAALLFVAGRQQMRQLLEADAVTA